MVFLLQFCERFKEVKEAARLAREKSQDKMELANVALNIAAPQVHSHKHTHSTHTHMNGLLKSNHAKGSTPL